VLLSLMQVLYLHAEFRYTELRDLIQDIPFVHMTRKDSTNNLSCHCGTIVLSRHNYNLNNHTTDLHNS
jgi:hypothetical protein